MTKSMLIDVSPNLRKSVSTDHEKLWSTKITTPRNTTHIFLRIWAGPQEKVGNVAQLLLRCGDLKSGHCPNLHSLWFLWTTVTCGMLEFIRSVFFAVLSNVPALRKAEKSFLEKLTLPLFPWTASFLQCSTKKKQIWNSPPRCAVSDTQKQRLEKQSVSLSLGELWKGLLGWALKDVD